MELLNLSNGYILKAICENCYTLLFFSFIAGSTHVTMFRYFPNRVSASDRRAASQRLYCEYLSKVQKGGKVDTMTRYLEEDTFNSR